MRLRSGPFASLFDLSASRTPTVKATTKAARKSKQASHLHAIYHVISVRLVVCKVNGCYFGGAGIAQWLERRTPDRKVPGSSPGRSGGKSFFSRVSFLCCLLLIRYPFHPRVTAVARKRSRSFCQKCRWQVTAKHTYILIYQEYILR